jgi:hypothetical protein
MFGFFIIWKNAVTQVCIKQFSVCNLLLYTQSGLGDLSFKTSTIMVEIIIQDCKSSQSVKYLLSKK